MRRRVKGTVAVLLTLVLAFGLLAGCDRNPAEEPNNILDPITMIVDKAIADYTMEPYWKDTGLELLDLVKDEEGYTLLAQDGGETYQIKLDRQFQEQSRTETALPNTSRVLASKKGEFAYAKNEAGLFDLYKDGEPYLAVGGEAGGDCQMLFSNGRLFTYAYGRLFCNEQEIAWKEVLSDPQFSSHDELVTPVGLAERDHQVFAIVCNQSEELGLNYNVYYPVNPKTGALQLEGSLSSSLSGRWFSSKDDRIYLADGSGLIYVVQEVDNNELRTTEQAFLDMTEESLPWNNLRQMIVLSDRRVLLLFSDRLIEVTPVFSPNTSGET